jgi:hypothetical protein
VASDGDLEKKVGGFRRVEDSRRGRSSKDAR